MTNVYGEWLKAQREVSGLTQQELADLAIMTRSHIAHIEAGRRIPSAEDARRLDAALGTGNVLQSFLPKQDVAVADYFETALELEQQATVIQEFALSLVPGVLQTEGYARAVLRPSVTPRSEEERDRLLVTRLRRGTILSDPATPLFCALLDEAVLRRHVGSPEVMAEQLTHIVGLVEADRVRVHVLPFGAGYHPLLQGMLSLMMFDDQPPVAYGEGVLMGKLHDSPAMVETLQRTYTLALGDALPRKESLALLRATAEEYEHDD
ncbi:helix-turn-helix transcriptional regulator [Streptomyces somaliensis DSM 40738]|uniref:Helix-turn-helix transcriptional regulator n=1 Tax=Streptomyces somaliensis (strain ATCC 33201 / DSM 40738 / JCM 12659 / KCTC 9044 / NCTC 11332 / NRRL B-12077 / IP 733) TaxID=1134445 RepID=A0AA44ICA0_STRE0|nr:helix-turn-helix transcriptional regulator [Streptomyces somaliensis]MCQ0022806.1 helix-turn-helix transcriptional regulator [Streptomyces somaliensis DSM 40738]NKY12968.1 helix-turn-helix transcriptional regulator [Streptomyces somaliensis DSM 40738]